MSMRRKKSDISLISDVLFALWTYTSVHCSSRVVRYQRCLIWTDGCITVLQLLPLSVWRLKGAATSRKKKNCKKFNIGVIDLKFTQYIPTMVSDIVYKWKSDQTSMTSIIEIEIWNLVWLNLRSLLTNDHLAFCDYLHQSWNIRSWFCLPRENVFLHIRNII